MKKDFTLSKHSSFCLTIALMLMAFVALAQELPKIEYTRTDHSTTDWFLESRKPNPNYYKVQRLYNDFFKAHPLEKSPQRSIILRWLQVNRNYLDAAGNVVIAPVPAEEMQRLMRANKPQANARQGTATSPYPAWNDMTGTWRMIGPYHNKDKPCDGGGMSGGFNDRVYINPYNIQNLYAGQSYGGLWVSQDQGSTWKLTDAELPNGKNTYANRDVYYGEIEASKTNSSLVFAATEAGLLKSTNAGTSWSLVSDLNYTNRPTERAYFVATSNHDPLMLLASYGRKIYRTTNGGSTWTVVFDNSAGGANYSLNVHNTTGVPDRKYNFAGLSFHPTANNIVYLAAREATTNRVVIHKSTDYGQTWSVFIPGSRQVGGVTETTTDGPVKMEIVPSAPDKIYLLNVFQGLGSSSTIGATKGIVKYNSASGDRVQALAYPVTGHLLDDCMVSVTDSSVLYLGGYASGEVHKSTNGGRTFVTNNPGYTNCPNYVHPDIRGFSVVGDLVLIACDGGNYISTNGMTTVQPTGKWISAIDLWGFSSAFKGDVVAAGDDHGPTEVRWFDGDSGWEHDGGGDSKDITINPAQPRWIYAMDVYRKYRMVTKEAAYDKAHGIDSSSVSALKYHAVHPNIYGKSYPIQETNLLVSNDNMATIADTLYRFPGIITRVKQPLRNPAIFYVLVNSRDIYKSINGGSSFTPITLNTTVTGGNTNITDIEVSQDGSVVWLSYGQVQTTCKVLKSTNGGATWVNYSTGLPSPTVSNITMQRGTNGGIYVSTDGGGVWYRDNAMSAWALLGTGLPMMGYVRSAYVVPNKKAYRMGTSRGAFEHELAFNTTADALISVDRNGAVTCRDTLLFRDYSAYQGTTSIRYAWTFAGGTPSTSTQENPGVTYANPGVYDVSLTVTDANNVSSTHTLTNFISVSASSCASDTLRGKAIQTLAQSSFLRANLPSLNNTNTYTLMAWVKMNGTQADYAGMVSLSTTSGSVHLNLKAVNADSTQIGYHHPNGEWWFNSGLYLKPNTWAHVALVVTPTAISIVKDGQRSSHTGRTVAPSSFTGTLTMGAMAGAEWYRGFIGELDEVAIYKRALTDDDIRRMMHLTKNHPKYPAQNDVDLIAYYQFNESHPKAIDRVGTKDADFYGNSRRIESSGPFSGGVSETMASVASAGPKSFSSVGLALELPASGTYPSGAVTAYRLNERPFLSPSANTFANYWVIRNWGAAKTFSPLVSLTLGGVSLSASDLSSPTNQRLFSRPQNSHLANWFIRELSATSATGSPTGSVTFPGSSLTTFGQLVLNRNPVTRYVSSTGTNTNPVSATSWATATANLQGAINASASGEQVFVKAGLYKPTTGTGRSISFAMKPGVEIYGSFMGIETSLSSRVLTFPGSTTLSGDIGTADNVDNSYHVISNPPGLNNTAILDGFVITGGNANAAADFFGNRGGGVWNQSGQPTFRQCLFVGNYALYGGAMNNYGAGSGNSASPVLVNCSFQGNTADYGGAMYNDGITGGSSNPSLTNCSFQGNAAPNGGAMYNDGSSGISNPTLTNCVLFGNGGNKTISNISASVSAKYSLFDASVTGYGSGPGNLTTTASPFASTTNTQLACGSPAINAGDPTTNPTITGETDLAGNARFFGGRVDMGAFELASSTATRLYVRASATGANTGLNWTDAFTNLQSTLNLTCSPDITEIRVATGVYTPTGTPASPGTDRTVSFAMRNGVAILGGYAGTGANPDARTPLSTTLSGNIGNQAVDTDNSYHVFNNPAGLTNTAILDGFVITGGKADGSSNGYGAGMYNTGGGAVCSPTLRNCLFQNNSAYLSGGAICNDGVYGISSPTLINCAFQNNSATYGGAILNDGAYGNANPILTNCSFQGNSAAYAGAIYTTANGGVSRTNLVNCVLFGNGGANTFAGTPGISARYSLFDASVTSYTSGPGNLTTTTSPFASTTSTQLAACSPAINAGSSTAFNATGLTTDIAGNPRFYNFGTIDIGAYEFNSPLPTSTSLSVGTPTATSVMATWMMTPATVPAEIRWRAIGTSAWSSATTTASATTYAITGLTAETTYEWQVRPNCPATPNYVSGSNFGTSPYCRPTYAIGCNSGDALTSFSLNNVALSQNTGCSAGSFTYIATNQQVALGQPVTVSGTFSSNSSEGVTIWADLNRNNVFESNEVLYQRAAAPGPFSGMLTIPSGTATGALRIRVLIVFNTTPANPCGSYGYGETEDYQITVTSGTTCTVMTTTKAGSWDDPTVWSCNRVPTSTDGVTVGHIVTVPTGVTRNALKISYGAGGKLSFGTGSKIRLGL